MAVLFVGVYVFFLSFILLYSLMELNLLFIYLFKSENRVDSEMNERPYVTIQLPVYNEMYVVERLIDSICKLNYPKNRMEIQVLDDSSDETVALVKAKVNYWKEQGVQIEQLIRPTRSGFKAGALAFGLETAKGEFIAIFDADFDP